MYKETRIAVCIVLVMTIIRIHARTSLKVTVVFEFELYLMRDLTLSLYISMQIIVSKKTLQHKSLNSPPVYHFESFVVDVHVL